MMKSTKSCEGVDSKVLEMDEKLKHALREDSVDSAVVLAELRSLNDDLLDHSNTKFRVRLERFLESTPLEVFLVVLVIVDVVILLVMLLMDLNILHLYLQDGKDAAQTLSNTLRSNCLENSELQHYNGSNLITINRYLNHEGCVWGQQNNTDSSAFTTSHHRRRRSAGPTAEGTNPTTVVLLNVGHILHIGSVVILAIMVGEVILKIFALGFKYFKGKLEVIDGIVIMISFAMDLYFIDGISSDGVNNGATLLVIFLLWRILRVFNALLVTAKKRLQFRIRVQKRMRKSLEDKLAVLEDDIKNHENHIENLHRLATRHELPDYEVKSCKPLVRQLKKANTSAGLASMMQMSMGLMHGMNNMKKSESSIADNLRNPPPAVVVDDKSCESVSDMLSSAMSATEQTTRQVDVVHDCTNNILPVPLVAVMATQGSPSIKRSSSRSSSFKGSQNIPSFEFAKALATGKSETHSNDTGLLSWNNN